MAEVKNLTEGLLDEMNRVREIIIVYKELPKNAGMFAAFMMQIDIANAEISIKQGDVVQMIKSYSILKEYQQ